MALPFAIPAALSTALTALRGAKAVKTGVKAARMAGDALKGLVTKKGAKQLALDLGDVGKKVNMSDKAGVVDRVKRGFTPEGFAKNLGTPMTKEDIAMTVAPDLLFGGITAATTEGDLADKAIAGLGSAAGGIAGGIGGRGLLGPKSGIGILGTEMIGGMVGDQVGYGVADSIIRAKHGGATPAEQSMAAADEAYKKQLYDQFLAENGLG